MEQTLWCTLVVLVVAVTVRGGEEASEDYLPRSIRPNEDSMPERPPAQEETPLSFAVSLKPVEFQYMVPLDAPAQYDGQAFRYEGEETLEKEQQQQLQLPSRTEIETVLRKYFGSKSKYLYDKDQVGIAGKENRFRRSAGSSGASASSSSSSSSYSTNDSPTYFGQQDFSAGFGSFGVNGAGFGGYGGGDAINFGGGYNQGFAANGEDNINMRFGGDETVRGVYSGASSSIDSNGKATYSVKAGKF